MINDTRHHRRNFAYNINLDTRFGHFELIDVPSIVAACTEKWQNHTLTRVNDSVVRIGIVEGEFHWHKHDDTDDFFLVLKGALDIELRDRTVTLNSGEVFVVPAGVEHRPVARGEVHILLIEPTGTANTGDKATAAPRIVA